MDTKKYIEELEERCEILQEKVLAYEHQISLVAAIYNLKNEPKFAVIYLYAKYHNSKGMYTGDNAKSIGLCVIHRMGKAWQILYGAEYEEGKPFTDRRTKTGRYVGDIRDAVVYAIKEAGYLEKEPEFFEHSLDKR
jgi:hypothetical protein